MPKLKSHSGAGKRFRVTKNGRIKRAKMGKNHILTKKETKRKRGLRAGGYVDSAFEGTIRNMLPKK